ncbi:phosphate ABC transporter substrate-binding protein PstS [Phormidium sp. CLA17]|uniref:phosphate ABC transporter substrate-binding protein PstS n=1 Tax=Leptolyngbya sp. Cla-17 TaxID=2803751 RepID=UPI00149160FA|nr:phosphate ABC transporter substrate-binding protein PstS [Leptolyngbya sp. Cla-17]MBM0741834.1 phosphate ABC transporter substrate-binding protein PstS [Leptolyngbya sp. Cla-17]
MVSLVKISRWALSASAIALAAGLASCAPSAPPTTGGTPAVGSSPAAGGGDTISISGAGASAPNSLYQRWFSEYRTVKQNVQVSYQSIGSGAGVNQFLAGTVDFGATDDPIKDADRAKSPQARGTMIQIPTTGLFIVFAYNLEGVKDLKLSRATYCGIADGSIKTWNDPKIAKDNAGATLPSTPLTFVFRSDGSGTTAIFTKHLAAACPGWKPGSGKSIEWPTGQGAKGNEGVTAQIKQAPGAIGYVEYTYARENQIDMAALQNKAGDFVTPTPEAAAKSLDGEKPNEQFVISVPDPAGQGAYPIVSLTYALLYGNYPAPKGSTLKELFKWALKEGKTATTELGFIPLPDSLVTDINAKLDTIEEK